MESIKVSSYLLVGLFIMLFVVAANHSSSAIDKEASIVFVVA